MLLYSESALTEAGGRDNNEDALVSTRQGDVACWAVCDGLGGHHGGEIASQIATEAIAQAFTSSPACSDAAVQHYLESAEAALVAAQKSDPSLDMMRTTAVILIADERQAAWGHIGDSRLYHFRDGRILSQTRDHSVPAVFAATGQISADEIRHHVDRSRLLRSLGEAVELKPALVSATPVASGDAFLLCTDGFWEFVYEAEMEADLASASSPDQWLANMRQRLLHRVSGDNDNYTAIAVWMGNRGAAAANLPPPNSQSVKPTASPPPPPAAPAHSQRARSGGGQLLWVFAALVLIAASAVGGYLWVNGRLTHSSAAVPSGTAAPERTNKKPAAKPRASSGISPAPDVGDAAAPSPAPPPESDLTKDVAKPDVSTTAPDVRKEQAAPQDLLKADSGSQLEDAPKKAPAPTPSAPYKETFIEAVKAYRADKYEEAIRLFERSLALFDVESYGIFIPINVRSTEPYVPSWFIAQAEAKLHHCDSAERAAVRARRALAANMRPQLVKQLDALNCRASQRDQAAADSPRQNRSAPPSDDESDEAQSKAPRQPDGASDDAFRRGVLMFRADKFRDAIQLFEVSRRSQPHETYRKTIQISGNDVEPYVPSWFIAQAEAQRRNCDAAIRAENRARAADGRDRRPDLTDRLARAMTICHARKQ